MSSDSSDSEELALLREAQDTQFLKENLYNKERVSPILVSEEKPVSLRLQRDENEQFNFLKVTPEFRQHVAKHLTKILDNKLLKEIEYGNENRETKNKRKHCGVRLFSHSRKLLKIEDSSNNQLNLIITKPNLIPRSKQTNLVTEEDLKALAISGEDILSKKHIKHWSNRTKSKIFVYKKTKNGTLELLEPAFK